ncbi:peptidoglycan-binding domain-containing protein [Streptomyces sp. NPDC002817]|uniref:peptidoglycan-binding domain-containing protein n=1 Tax=Streptomyces sp. NPDC088357 TaxID=3154655 RepID=UPI00341F27CC
MNFRATRARMATAAVSAAVAGALAVSASPASASSGDGYVSGGSSFYDDFGDEGTLSTSSYASSNAACFWQRILWAEGAKESNGTAFDAADIDGRFGANTKYATKKLQARWSLTADGIVGKKTFGYADAKRERLTDEITVGKLEYVSTDSQSAGKRYRLKYHGASHTFTLFRGSTGKWGFYDDNGTFRLAGYKSRSC